MLLVALLPVIAFNREVHLAILVILMLLAYFGPSQRKRTSMQRFPSKIGTSSPAP